MSNSNTIKNKAVFGLFWSFFERVGSQLVSFIVSILLARLLLPEEYGVIAIVLVFINICDVFINCGFSQALIQGSEIDDTDYSSVFYFSLVTSIILYALIFFIAPYIAIFYEMPILSPVLRVMGLRMILSPLSSIQRAKVSRDLEFKKFFFATIGGTIASAIIGIFMAYFGFGVWALVAQSCSNLLINTVILCIIVKWKPKLVFSITKTKKLLSFGWKVLVTGLIDVLYQDFRSLYVGKLYTATDLAYYTRGRQFPNLITDNINSSISSVLFPVMSKKNDDMSNIKMLTKRSIKTSAFIVTPLMFGLAAVAEPLVTIFLTDKWLPCVPFLQVLCINNALMPLQTANVQAIYAVGRSDIVLKLDIVKKSFGFIMVLIFARISIMSMTLAGVVTGIFSLFVNAFPNKKLFGYGFFEQVKDIIPFWLMSGLMMICVRMVSLLGFTAWIELLLMIFVGIVVYILISAIFKVESFSYILNTIKSFFKK